MVEFLWRQHWKAWKAREYPGFHTRLRELRDEERLDAAEWRERQAVRVRELLSWASETVDYYANTFAETGFDATGPQAESELARVPLLTKECIREHLDRLVSRRVRRSALRPNATGGSTGVPLNFYQDDFYETISMALAARIPEWWGVQPHDKIASVWGADRDLADLSWRERAYQWRSRTRILNAFRMRDEDLEDFARMLERWRPPYMKGYATALEALARHVMNSGRTPLRFRAISSSAEMLWPEQRELISNVFRSPVYNFYGSREISGLAAECPEEHRLHQVSTWRYIEIVHEDGSPMPAGEPGLIAVTDASNFAMPFIRYVNGDVAKLATQACPCGRPGPVLEELMGRSTDLIQTREGEFVHGEFFTHLFYGTEDIRQFQVHQVALDRIVVRYVPADPKRQPSSLPTIVAQIRERMGHDVGVETVACEEIPCLPSGKRRFTISDVTRRGAHTKKSVH